jgi:FtsZ-binding cell division protein ZapB
MKMENFDKLESKITWVLQALDKLKQDNLQISASYEGLTNKVYEYEEKTKELVSQNNQLRSKLKTKESKCDSEKEKVKKRIKKLIEKIDMLEKLG